MVLALRTGVPQWPFFLSVVFFQSTGAHLTPYTVTACMTRLRSQLLNSTLIKAALVETKHSKLLSVPTESQRQHIYETWSKDLDGELSSDNEYLVKN